MKPVLYVWPDTVWNFFDDFMRHLNSKQFVRSLHFCWDRPGPLISRQVRSDYATTCGITPIPEELFYCNSNTTQEWLESKPIDVCFMGSIYNKDRQNVYDSLTKLQGKYKIVYGKGQRSDQSFSVENYAEIMRKSKICINTPTTIADPTNKIGQHKGRVYEATLCSAITIDVMNGPYTLTDYPDVIRGQVHYMFCENTEAINPLRIDERISLVLDSINVKSGLLEYVASITGNKKFHNDIKGKNVWKSTLRQFRAMNRRIFND